MACIISSSNIALVNHGAVGEGIPLFEVNLLLLNTGLVKTKSSAIIFHFEDNIAENTCFSSPYRSLLLSEISNSLLLNRLKKKCMRFIHISTALLRVLFDLS